MSAAGMALEKKALRARMRGVLRALPAEAIGAASARACARALSLQPLDRSSRVCVYLAMAQECQTSRLLEAFFDQGKAVYVPRVEGPSREAMRMLRVESMRHVLSLPRNSWGIPEPSDEEAAGMEDGLSPGALIDAVVVPGVAFDRTCRRLGHGRGYYDTFLARLQAARAAESLVPAAMVGLGLQEQLVGAVPVADHDLTLDYVCTPDDLLGATK